MKCRVDTDKDTLLFPTFGYRSNWWFVLKKSLGEFDILVFMCAGTEKNQHTGSNIEHFGKPLCLINMVEERSTKCFLYKLI